MKNDEEDKKHRNVMPTIRGRFGHYIWKVRKLNNAIMNRINMRKWLEENPDAIKSSPSKHVGMQPIRKDIDIEPERKIEWYKREFKYQLWKLLDHIPSVHRKNQAAIKQWDKELKEHVDKDMEWRKKEWKAGRPTNLLMPESTFFKPHPVPRRGDLFWKIGKMEMVIVGIDDKKDNP